MMVGIPVDYGIHEISSPHRQEEMPETVYVQQTKWRPKQERRRRNREIEEGTADSSDSFLWPGSQYCILPLSLR